MRKIRLLRDGSVYHVVSRANRREFIFDSEKIKEMFLEVVGKAKKKYSFTITNFCVMGNHFHLMVAPGKNESLSKIMQWILSVFAVKYNKIYGYLGHVWHDRFKSRIIDSLQSFIHAFCYIAEKSVRAGITTNPCEYRYSGVAYMRRGAFDLIERPSPVLRLMAPMYIGPMLLPSPK